MKLNELLSLALYEDIGSGDITSLATVDFDKKGNAQIIAKQSGILCGCEIVQNIFNILSKQVTVNILKNDGQVINNQDIIATIEGPLHYILQGERTCLNILGHLSGVSTQTNEIVKLLPADNNLKILDTRKTFPLWRDWQKYAVKTGGGQNHRIGLYDMILVKENHINAAGGLKNAIERSIEYKNKNKSNWKIEVEVKNIEEVKTAIQYPIDIIMLDNMNIDEMNEAIKIAQGKIKLEASGNITKENISKYAILGIDYISIGALTHSVNNFDFSLLVL